MRCCLSLGFVLALGACQSDAANPTKHEVAATVKLAGVFPDRFECASVTTTEALTQILGQPTQVLDSASSIPRGVPRPCTYRAGVAEPFEYWTYDFDCRDGYKRRADELFEQYKQYNADRIAKYNEVTDAGVIKPSDAGIVYTKPGAPSEVAVGAKGLDHNDQGLIFIDDDAPCYVRVIGPDATRRLELAKAIAKNLTFANAPMEPRPFK